MVGLRQSPYIQTPHIGRYGKTSHTRQDARNLGKNGKNERRNNMTPNEREELIIKFNEIRLGLREKAATNETAAEVRDLIDTIINILTK